MLCEQSWAQQGTYPYRRMAKALKTNNIAPNLLQRQFREHGSRKVLLTDITYLFFDGDQKSYLCTILDAYTKQVLVIYADNLSALGSGDNPTGKANSISRASCEFRAGDRH